MGMTTNVIYTAHVCWYYEMKKKIAVYWKKLILWKEHCKSGCLEIFSLCKMFHRTLNPFVKNACLIPCGSV